MITDNRIFKSSCDKQDLLDKTAVTEAKNYDISLINQ